MTTETVAAPINQEIMDKLKAVMKREQFTLKRLRDIFSGGTAHGYNQFNYDAINDPLSLVWRISVDEEHQVTLKFNGEFDIGEYKGMEERTFKNIRLHSMVVENTANPSYYLVIETAKNKVGFFNWVIHRAFTKHNNQQLHLKHPAPLMYVLGEEG